MFKNYLKIAWRNLLRNKSYAFLNIFGLAVGLTCFILITIYVSHEWSYDKFHTNYDNLYRVTESMVVDDGTETYASTYAALAPSLDFYFEEIDAITHIYPNSGLIVGPDNQKYQEDGIMIVDSAFFDMFSFTLLRGNSTEVLNKPASMVITPIIAAKFFGESDPIGRTLSFKDARNTIDFEITGVVEAPPSNSHIQFNYLISYESLQTMRPWEYNSQYYPPMYTYALVSSSEKVESIEARLDEFTRAYYGNELGEENSFGFQPFGDIHLKSTIQNELSTGFDITYLYLFGAVSIFILIIACINFMNLATARSLRRAREVGMRKTLGAVRPQLIGQFLSEAVIMAALGLFFSVLLVEALLPYFNAISGKSLSLDLFSNIESILLLFGLVVVVGIFSGSYPAFFLSSFSPIKSLKGNTEKQGGSGKVLRRGLVVFQFFISTALIFSTIIITKQLDFLQNSRLGFDKEQVMLLHLRETQNQFDANSLKTELLTIPGVQQASATSGAPGIGAGIHGFTAIPESNEADSGIVQTLTVDFDYVETLGLEILQGRAFSEEFGTDETSAFIINEQAAEFFGWDDPLNEELTLNYWLSERVPKTGNVIGVVSNFQYNSLRQSIDPVVIHVLPSTYYHDYLAVKLATNNIQDTIAEIEEKWAVFNPERPMEYAFLDDTFEALYRSESRLSKIFRSFAVLAVVIACLGLFGLASYSTEQKVKEIGIRKVLGARIATIVTLLGKEITILIAVSLLVSLPVAYLLTNSWLNNFTERIDISIGLFLLSSLFVLILAWVTISYQTVKAALRNPVESLRSE
ncbi:MAG: ABC transporter permease [Balneola sp.]|nr:MAG: ABC transporter permease [Balneola sp.]